MYIHIYVSLWRLAHKGKLRISPYGGWPIGENRRFPLMEAGPYQKIDDFSLWRLAHERKSTVSPYGAGLYKNR